MGTKTSPGDFDCYAAAKPDEPMFILLGRDPCASIAVAFWVMLRQELDPQNARSPKLENARACARELEAYARAQGKPQELAAAFEAMARIARTQSSESGWWLESERNS